MPKVSAILPSLNVAAYIEKCLNSVQNQTLQDIEIICVDAGSTDGTAEIIRAHAASDSRITYVISEKRSYGYQMNLGLSMASGEYIAILDTDDMIEPDMYENLYKTAVEQDADFVKADYREFCEDEGELRFTKYIKTAPEGLYGGTVEPAKEHRCFHVDTTATWSGIYKNEFLKENRICYNETPGAAYQDTGFWFQVYAFAEKGYFLKKPFYLYRRDNPNSSVVRRGNAFAICDEFDFVLGKLEGTGRWPLVRDAFAYNFYDRYKWNLERIAKEFHIEFLERMKKDFDSLQEKANLNFTGWDSWEQEELQQIMRNPQAYYNQTLQGRKEFLDSLAAEERIIIYGAGKFGKMLYRALENKNRVRSFAVTGEADRGAFVEDVPVKSLNQLSEYGESGMVIVAVKSEKQKVEMVEYAKTLGFQRVISIPRGSFDFE